MDPAGADLTVAVPAAIHQDLDGERFSSLVPAIIGGALMMQTLSATVIANALPTMARSFHEDPIRLNTAITIYLLASAVFLPISGWMADRFGAKRIFLIAIVAYAASCAACGLAQNLTQMLLARAAEGAAGAMMGPVGRLVLLRSTPKHNLVRAMSVLTMPALLGPVIGPPIGEVDGVGVGTGVFVGTGVGVGTGVAVGTGVGVAVGTGVGVAVPDHATSSTS
ncbi:MAG TPA: MFS transporter [Caulobacteraceae bacterium]